MTDFISTRLFPEILNMSLTGSIVILAVLVIRFFLRKAPKKWSYLLWLVVAFRLACPVSLPSPISLLGAVNAPVTTGGTIEYIPQAIIQPQSPVVSPVTPAPGPSTPDTVAPTPQPPAPTPISVTDILSVVWLVGMAVLLVYSVISYLRLRRRLASAVILSGNVWLSDKVHSPFILGLFRPRIYIPFGLDEQTLGYVLAHEHCHLKRKDHIIKPLAFLLLTLHWFNPLCWLAFHLMGRDMEMSCDEQVLAQENGDRKVYSTALLSFAANRRFPAPSPLAFGEGEVHPRITNALNWKAPKVRVTVAAGVLCVAVLLLCALNPSSAPTQVAPGHCTVTHNGETAKYRMKQQAKPFYVVSMPNTVYDTLALPRAAVERDDIITFYVEAEDSPELKVTEYYHYTLNGHEEFHSGRTRTLLREESGGFSLRVYPRGEGTGDYIIYQIRRDEGGYYTFRADISASDTAGAYASVQDFLDQTMAAEKVAYHFTSGVNPDGGAATAPANVTDTKLIYLDKKGELSGLAPKGTLEAWESFYLVALDVASDQVVLAGGQYEEDGWYNLNGAFNVIALRYEDGSCDILGYEHQGGDNMDFKGIRSYEQALHDWYVKKYDLTEVSPPYVKDWYDLYYSTVAFRYDGDGWSIYIPINTWTQRDAGSWYSAYGTGAELCVSLNADTVDEQAARAEAEGRTVSDESGCRRIDYEYSSTFLYPREDGEGCWNVTVKWPASPSEDPYHPSPEQERDELLRMARSFTLRDENLIPFEVPNTYDINHNGTLETFLISHDPVIDVYRLSLQEDGQEIWCDRASTSHAGWNTIFAVTHDGLDYLLRYSPSISTGCAFYYYELFSLDENGEEVLLNRNEIEFDVNFGGAHQSFDPKQIAGFLEEVHTLLKDSWLLLSTQDFQFRSGGSGATFNGDAFWGNSYDNSDKSLEEILRLYAEERSQIQHRT